MDSISCTPSPTFSDYSSSACSAYLSNNAPLARPPNSESQQVLGALQHRTPRVCDTAESSLHSWLQEAESQQCTSPCSEDSQHSDEGRLVIDFGEEQQQQQQQETFRQMTHSKRSRFGVPEQIGYFGGTCSMKAPVYQPEVQPLVYNGPGGASVFRFHDYAQSIQYEDVLKAIRPPLACPLEQVARGIEERRAPPGEATYQEVPSAPPNTPCFDHVLQPLLDPFPSNLPPRAVEPTRQRCVPGNENAKWAPAEVKGRRKRRAPDAGEACAEAPDLLRSDAGSSEVLRRRQEEISRQVMASVMQERKDYRKRIQCPEIPSLDEAIAHGQRLQTWLENCSDPVVSMSKIQEFKKLMASLLASRQRRIPGDLRLGL